MGLSRDGGEKSDDHPWWWLDEVRGLIDVVGIKLSVTRSCHSSRDPGPRLCPSDLVHTVRYLIHPDGPTKTQIIL